MPESRLLCEAAPFQNVECGMRDPAFLQGPFDQAFITVGAAHGIDEDRARLNR